MRRETGWGLLLGVIVLLLAVGVPLGRGWISERRVRAARSGDLVAVRRVLHGSDAEAARSVLGTAVESDYARYYVSCTEAVDLLGEEAFPLLMRYVEERGIFPEIERALLEIDPRIERLYARQVREGGVCSATNLDSLVDLFDRRAGDRAIRVAALFLDDYRRIPGDEGGAAWDRVCDRAAEHVVRLFEGMKSVIGDGSLPPPVPSMPSRGTPAWTDLVGRDRAVDSIRAWAREHLR